MYTDLLNVGDLASVGEDSVMEESILIQEEESFIETATTETTTAVGEPAKDVSLIYKK